MSKVWNSSYENDIDDDTAGSLIDDNITTLKSEIRKRLETFFDNWANDPDAPTTLDVKDDAILAEHISGLTGTGAVDLSKIPGDLDDITEGSTNKYFSGKTLDDLPDGSTYKRVTGVNSSHQITNSSVANGGIGANKLSTSASFNGTVTRYVHISPCDVSIASFDDRSTWTGNHVKLQDGDSGGYINDYSGFSGCEYSSGHDTVWRGALHFPHGATLTQIYWHGRGSYGSGQETKIRIYRRAMNGTSWSLVVESVLGTNSEQYVTKNFSHTVDNSYAYMFEIEIEKPTSSGASHDGLIHGIRIAYTVNKPLP